MNKIDKIEINPPEIDAEPIDPNLGAEGQIRLKIIHILKIYPVISYSMLQIGLGSSLPPSIWRPVLAQMIEDKEIQEDHLFMTTPTGRQQTYTQIKLTTTTTTTTATA